VRHDVLRDHRAAADECVLPDAAELMHGAERADRGIVSDLYVAGQCGVVRENRVRTDMAIVRDVRVGHEEVFVANRRLPATTGGAAVDGDEFAEEVVVADGQLGVLALVLEVLWRTADRSVAVKLVALA